MQTKLIYLLESRDKRAGDKDWSAWAELVPGDRYTADDVAEFDSSLTADDFGDRHLRTQWRARMLPQHGYSVARLYGPAQACADGPLVLSRDMPASVHARNDEILTSLGV